MYLYMLQDSVDMYFKSTREETFFFAIKTRLQISATAANERLLQIYILYYFTLLVLTGLFGYQCLTLFFVTF